MQSHVLQYYYEMAPTKMSMSEHDRLGRYYVVTATTIMQKSNRRVKHERTLIGIIKCNTF